MHVKVRKTNFVTTILENSDKLSSVSLVGFGEKSNTLSLTSSSSCTSNAMNVILDGEGKRLVDDELDLGDIESSSSNI